MKVTTKTTPPVTPVTTCVIELDEYELEALTKMLGSMSYNDAKRFGLSSEQADVIDELYQHLSIDRAA